MGVSMDIALLRRVGTRVAEVASTVDGAYAKRAGSLTPGAGSPCPGWSAVAAAARSAESWRPFIDGLQAAVARHGRALTAAADAQAAVDAAAAARTGAARGLR